MDTNVRSSLDKPGFGAMLREWRRTRGSSQLDLALHCGLSQRHLSFLESGRSRPSRGMLLNLACALNVPLREQNAMLLAAGFAPLYKQRNLDAADMRPIDQALDHVLRQQEPYPAIVVDELHTIVRANRGLHALMHLLTGGAPMDGPVNAVEAVLRPDGLRGAVENWEDVAAWMVRRLRAEVLLDGIAAGARTLLERVLQWPDVAQAASAVRADQELAAHARAEIAQRRHAPRAVLHDRDSGDADGRVPAEPAPGTVRPGGRRDRRVVQAGDLSRPVAPGGSRNRVAARPDGGQLGMSRLPIDLG